MHESIHSHHNNENMVQPLIQCVLGALSPGVKRQGREVDRSPPSSARVKEGGGIPPLPHISSWHCAELIKHRDNPICFSYLI
jgi:hypothetical protein